jgi:RNA polymerase sigma factor (sigma-70 family)
MPERATTPNRRLGRPDGVAMLAGVLFERHAPRLRAVARAHTKDPADDRVDDTVQAGLLAFMRSYSGPLEEDDALRYLIRCVMTQGWKQGARDRRRLESSADVEQIDALGTAGNRAVDSEVRDPLEYVLGRELVAESRNELAELSVEERACIWLSAIGLGTSEIAAALALSERQVRKRVEKGNRRLRNGRGESP